MTDKLAEGPRGAAVDADRAALLAAPRPRRDLPLVALDRARRRLPLMDDVRDEDHRYRPVDAVWEITLACDLSCRHCGSRAGKPRPDELTTEECFDVVDQLAALGVKEVILIGGEAYLRPDLFDVVRRIRDRGMEPLLVTGGRSFTKELAASTRDAGVASVSVSLDGMRETHDRLRALKGSFDAALRTMDLLSEAGVPISANTQINRLSMDELEDVFETIAARGAHSWQLQITTAMGRAADEPDVLLQPYDLLALFPVLGALADRCRERDIVLWPGNNIGYFGPIERKLRGGMARGHMASCGAGCLGIGIESNGTVKGCPSLATKTWAAGNVRDERLETLWLRAPALRAMRKRSVDELWGYCKSCYYAETCFAGCTWTSESLMGRPGNNPICHHRALEHDRQGLRERLVQREAAPGDPFDHGRFEIVVEPAQR